MNAKKIFLFGLLTLAVVASAVGFAAATPIVAHADSSTPPCVSGIVKFKNNGDGSNSNGSGFNRWGSDKYTRKVTICPTSDPTKFTGTVGDKGITITLGGEAPNANDPAYSGTTLSKGELVTFNGGGTVTVTGTLKSVIPAITVIDMGCDSNGINCAYPSSTEATLAVFFQPGFSGGFDNKWGWTYTSTLTCQIWTDKTDAEGNEVFIGNISDQGKNVCPPPAVAKRHFWSPKDFWDQFTRQGKLALKYVTNKDGSGKRGWVWMWFPGYKWANNPKAH